MNPKQIAIEALEEVINFTEKHLEMLRARLEKLKGDNTMSAQDDGGHIQPPTGPK